MAFIRMENGNPVAVGNIYCLGINYNAHMAEMRDTTPERPVIFSKPTTALLPGGGTIMIPALCREMHHEVELVVLIGTGGKNIPAPAAFAHIGGYALGLDMTMRDIQSAARAQGRPWTLAKGFDTSSPVSTFVPPARVPDPHALDLKLWVNGQLRQSAGTALMINKIPDIISFLSSYFTLEPGDLIFTGTPAGVGPVVPGDVIRAELVGLAELVCPVAAAV